MENVELEHKMNSTKGKRANHVPSSVNFSTWLVMQKRTTNDEVTDALSGRDVILGGLPAMLTRAQ